MKTMVPLFMMMALTAGVTAQEDIATLRQSSLETEPAAPPLARELNTDERKARNYPEQPPLIPHKIEGYQLDLNANRCLACHNRHRVEESGAPMVSVTHYMDRDMQVLAEVSRRRYFCLQCHVPQTDAKPLVENEFRDVADIIREGKE